MFFHNYLYRMKCILRDRQTVFWTLLFPIILSVLFNLSLRNISSAETFSKIKIGVVNNEEYNSNTAFKEALSSVSNSNENPDKSNLFDVKYTSKEEAEKLLKDNKIEGYLYFDNGIKLNVKKSGLNQTIIKSFLDDYKQSSATIQTIISRDPLGNHSQLMQSIGSRTDFLKEVQSSKSSPDPSVNYFYTLIAMACLYGGFMGLNEVIKIQGNLSPQGARINVAPTHKLKVFAVSVLAAATVSLSEIFILLAFLIFVLKISFGTQIGYILLTCIAGTLTGVTFGTCIASVVKAGEGVKIGLLIGLSMLMSFLSGMMYEKMKYIVNTKVPVLGYLNPANLITDCFYSLYYYNTHTQFFRDIIMLCGFTAAFSIITYLVLRRQKYASL